MSEVLPQGIFDTSEGNSDGEVGVVVERYFVHGLLLVLLRQLPRMCLGCPLRTLLELGYVRKTNSVKNFALAKTMMILRRMRWLPC